VRAAFALAAALALATAGVPRAPWTADAASARVLILNIDASAY